MIEDSERLERLNIYAELYHLDYSVLVHYAPLSRVDSDGSVFTRYFNFLQDMLALAVDDELDAYEILEEAKHFGFPTNRIEAYL